MRRDGPGILPCPFWKLSLSINNFEQLFFHVCAQWHVQCHHMMPCYKNHFQGWMLSGLDGTCYIDQGRARILPKQLRDLSDNTPSKCKSECNKLGYSLAGVQFGKQCFCGNNVASRAKIAPSNDCNMTCPGDGTVFCGGSWRMNIYSANEGEIN